MKKNKKMEEKILQVKVGLCGMIFGASAAVSYIDYDNSKKEQQMILEQQQFQEMHPYTWIGRMEISDEPELAFYPIDQLNIVFYQGSYFVTDLNLQKFGSKFQFEIVSDDSFRGKKHQVMVQDILPFRRIYEGNNPFVKLSEAYDVVDVYCNLHPLNQNQPFTMEINESFSMEDKDTPYSINDLYVVYIDGKIYLCQESMLGYFSSIGEKNYLFRIGLGDKNTIASHQVVKFTNLLATISYYPTHDEIISMEKAYQLLVQVFNQIDYNPFVASSSKVLNDFSSQQLEDVQINFLVASQYLDEYHRDYYVVPQMYYVEDVFLVELSYPQFILATKVDYDEQSDCYTIYPLQSSYSNLTPIEVKKKDSIRVMNSEDVFLTFLSFSGAQTASTYYDYLAAYLLRYGNPFELPQIVQAYGSMHAKFNQAVRQFSKAVRFPIDLNEIQTAGQNYLEVWENLLQEINEEEKTSSRVKKYDFQ